MKVMKAVHDNTLVAWVTCVGRDERVYGYLANTNAFHYSPSLDDDYYWEMDLEYVEIEPSEAVELINSGVGRFDQSKAWVVDRLTKSERTLTVDEVLGASAAHINPHDL